MECCCCDLCVGVPVNDRHGDVLQVGIRLNKSPPNVTYRLTRARARGAGGVLACGLLARLCRQKATGGLKITSTVPLTKASVCARMSAAVRLRTLVRPRAPRLMTRQSYRAPQLGDDPDRTIYAIMHEYRIHNAEVWRTRVCGGFAPQWRRCARCHTDVWRAAADAAGCECRRADRRHSWEPQVRAVVCRLCGADGDACVTSRYAWSSCRYVRCLYVYNKVDTTTLEVRFCVCGDTGCIACHRARLCGNITPGVPHQVCDMLARLPDSVVISCRLNVNFDVLLAKVSCWQLECLLWRRWCVRACAHV